MPEGRVGTILLIFLKRKKIDLFQRSAIGGESRAVVRFAFSAEFRVNEFGDGDVFFRNRASGFKTRFGKKSEGSREKGRAQTAIAVFGENARPRHNRNFCIGLGGQDGGTDDAGAVGKDETFWLFGVESFANLSV